MASKKESTFEEQLEQLEKIAMTLERGNVSLEEAISTFEEGIKLSKDCSEKLDEAEKKINILTQDQNGNLKEEKFVKEV